MASTSRQRADATRVVQAAGAVLWRPGPDGPELGIVHRPRYDDWSFPKGKANPGEHAQLTAVREVMEETGQRMVLGRRLPTIEYPVAGQPKQVRYWAGRALDQGEGGGRFEPNGEVDRLAWLSADEVALRLSRRLDGTVLEAFLSTPHDTVPIVLLRHGSAERRGDLYPDDQLRPLAPEGLVQADALADLLAGYGPRRVLSSPAARCVETVRPTASRTSTAIVVDPALSEPAHQAAPEAIGSWIRAQIAQGRPTVVCTHRPLLDGLLDAVLPSASSASGPQINGRPWARREAERIVAGRLDPGSAWILHVTRRKGPRQPSYLVAVDRLKP